MEKKKYFIHLVILAAVATMVFIFSNRYLGGYVLEKEKLAKEIWSSPDALYQWKLSDKAPFKNRFLFKSIIMTSNEILGGGENSERFHSLYISWSLFFLVACVCCFYCFLTCLGFNLNYALLGGLLLFLCPPITMAYSVPVHTREDTLAFLVLLLGLISIVKRKDNWVLLISILGIMCRETLLIIPFIFLFFSTGIFAKRIVFAAIPVILWLGLKFYIGNDGYDIWEGVQWNLSNPAQVLGFFWLSFHVFWILFLASFFHVRQFRLYENAPMNLIYSSAPWALVLIIGTTFIGGIFNEIRLLFLLFPWVISISLDFIRRNQEEFKKVVLSKKYRVYITTVFMIIAFTCYYLINHYQSIIGTSKYNIPFVPWIVATFLSFLFSAALAPLAFNLKSLKVRTVS